MVSSCAPPGAQSPGTGCSVWATRTWIKDICSKSVVRAGAWLTIKISKDFHNKISSKISKRALLLLRLSAQLTGIPKTPKSPR